MKKFENLLPRYRVMLVGEMSETDSQNDGAMKLAPHKSEPHITQPSPQRPGPFARRRRVHQTADGSRDNPGNPRPRSCHLRLMLRVQ